jgi:hypothetical protein
LPISDLIFWYEACRFCRAAASSYLFSDINPPICIHYTGIASNITQNHMENMRKIEEIGILA